MNPREQIITPGVVDGLLSKYRVPDEQKKMLQDIVALFLHADSPKEFAKQARQYTIERNITPTNGQAALIIFQQIHTDIQSMLNEKADEN